MTLPEDQHDPAEAAEDEDDNGRGAAPGVVANGGLVYYKDGQDGSCEDEECAEEVEVSEGDLDEELVVVWPEKEEDDGGNSSTGAAIKNQQRPLVKLISAHRQSLLYPKYPPPAYVGGDGTAQQRPNHARQRDNGPQRQ